MFRKGAIIIIETPASRLRAPFSARQLPNRRPITP
jgi:hypothetical protein